MWSEANSAQSREILAACKTYEIKLKIDKILNSVCVVSARVRVFATVFVRSSILKTITDENDDDHGKRITATTNDDGV